MNLRNITVGQRIISIILSGLCTIMVINNPIDIRHTNAPKLISDKEIESTNDRKKVKC